MKVLGGDGWGSRGGGGDRGWCGEGNGRGEE